MWPTCTPSPSVFLSYQISEHFHDSFYSLLWNIGSTVEIRPDCDIDMAVAFILKQCQSAWMSRAAALAPISSHLQCIQVSDCLCHHPHYHDSWLFPPLWDYACLLYDVSKRALSFFACIFIGYFLPTFAWWTLRFSEFDHNDACYRSTCRKGTCSYHPLVQMQSKHHQYRLVRLPFLVSVPTCSNPIVILERRTHAWKMWPCAHTHCKVN